MRLLFAVGFFNFAFVTLCSGSFGPGSHSLCTSSANDILAHRFTLRFLPRGVISSEPCRHSMPASRAGRSDFSKTGIDDLPRILTARNRPSTKYLEIKSSLLNVILHDRPEREQF